jgi:hypothetical protein
MCHARRVSSASLHNLQKSSKALFYIDYIHETPSMKKAVPEAASNFLSKRTKIPDCDRDPVNRHRTPPDGGMVNGTETLSGNSEIQCFCPVE